MSIFILFVSPGILFDGDFSLWVSLKENLWQELCTINHLSNSHILTEQEPGTSYVRDRSQK